MTLSHDDELLLTVKNCFLLRKNDYLSKYIYISLNIALSKTLRNRHELWDDNCLLVFVTPLWSGMNMAFFRSAE